MECLLSGLIGKKEPNVMGFEAFSLSLSDIIQPLITSLHLADLGPIS
jgi:hypothetical protein